VGHQNYILTAMITIGCVQQHPSPPSAHTQRMTTRTRSAALEGRKCKKKAGWNYFNIIINRR
jgi:hypothetical protein